MRIEKSDSSTERKILIGLITNQEFLSKVSSKWGSDGLLKSKWSNLIGRWCTEYFHKYGTPPGPNICNIFEEWSSNGHTDKELAKLIERFLDSLSNEYSASESQIDTRYLLDLAVEHFNLVALEKLSDLIQADIGSRKISSAIAKAQSFNPITIDQKDDIDVLCDVEAIQDAFSSSEEPIIQYPGDLGKFFGRTLEREGFVAFMAPDKTGKSMWLIDMAWTAMLQRRKVAYFEAGDASRRAILRRLMVRASSRPRTRHIVNWPIQISKDPYEEFATVKHERREYTTDLSWQEAWKACQKVTKKIKSKNSYLKLSCHANSTLSVRTIGAKLDQWEREGWSPDVVIVDYADILAPLHAADDTREQINRNWKGLRAISQMRSRPLVITATQSSAKGYAVKLLTRKEFSDDKRKMAHVTAMIGINVSDYERSLGLCRLNYIVLRDDEFQVDRVVHVAGCLALVRPAILSTF